MVSRTRLSVGPLLWIALAGVLASGAGLGCSALRSFLPPQPRVERWQTSGDLEYLEVVPEGPGADAELPMVVIVHGMGDRPRPEWVELDAPHARYILPRAPKPYGQGYSWFSYRVGEANPHLAGEVKSAIVRLAGALGRLLREKPTEGRAVLSGFSQGGILSYGIALWHPDLVELAHPVSGWLPEALWPLRAPEGWRPPIHASHGTADAIVPYPPTRRMVDTLATRGFDIELAPFAGVGHQISPAMRVRMDSMIQQGIARATR